MSSPDSAADAAPQRWLAVVGLGEDGLAGLGDAAREAIANARYVFGGKRHLVLVERVVTGEKRAWPSPFDVGAVTALAGQRVCVLASGDPFWHGVGATLARTIPATEMRVFPAPSAFSLAAARLGWALQDVETVSLHGRPVELIVPLLHPGRKVLALTSDSEGPAAIARLLIAKGFPDSRLTVLQALGGPDELTESLTAENAHQKSFNPLNVLAIEVGIGGWQSVHALGFGLRDALFSSDGQLTKREIRAMTLSALEPRRGQLLWDVGAGSGSVGIEWMLADRSMRAVAIEQQPERVGRIRANALSLGVPGLEIVTGTAPQALAGLPAPDAIFVGGGGSEPGVMDAAIAALKGGGRLVANAVTLEMEAVLLALQASHGGALTRIALARAEPVGGMSGWRPAMPVTQWAWTKAP